MSHINFDLLVELPEVITGVLPLDSTASNLGLRCPTVLYLEGSFALINGETGTLYRKHSLPSTKSRIISCVYLPSSRSFILALSDSTILTIPENAKASNEYFIESWPVQPTNLYLVNSTDILVQCADGNIAYASVTNNRVVSPNPIDNSEKFSSGSLTSNIFVSCTSSKIAASYIKSNSKSTKGKRNASNATDSNELFVTVWNKPVVSSNSTEWLTSSTKSSTSNYPIPATSILKSVTHTNSNSFSLFLDDLSWIKFNFHGSILFNKQVLSKPIYVFYSNGILWTLSEEKELVSFDTQYGIVIKKFNFTLANATSFSSVYPALLSLGSSGQTYGLLLAGTNSKGPTSLYLKEFAENSEVKVKTLFDVFDTVSSEEKIVTSKLNDIIKENKEKLDEYLELYYRRAINDNFDNPIHSKKINKSNRMIINASLSLFYLNAFEEIPIQDIEDSQWEYLKPFIRAGLLSLKTNKSIIAQALLYGRYDIISELIRFCSDLSESHIISILNFASKINKEHLNELYLYNSCLYYGENNKYIVNKKSKKNLSKLNLIKLLLEYTLIRSSSFSSILLFESLKSLDFQYACILLRLFSLIIFNYTSKVINPNLISSNEDGASSSLVSLTIFSSEQLERSIVWIKSLVDFFFTSFIMEAKNNPKLITTLNSVLLSLNNSKEALQYTEETHGLWLQLERILNKKCTNLNSNLGIYQVEKITL